MLNFKKILIVHKRSKYELDSKFYSLSELQKLYELQGGTFDRAFESHKRQLASRDLIQKEILPQSTQAFREDLDALHLESFDLVIALGGDNHFTFVAHRCMNVPILGCNSDNQTSVGALLGFTPETLATAVDNQWANCNLESWSLIDSEIRYPSGEIVHPYKAISEISIRNNSPDLTSRYWIHLSDLEEEQKSSGLLLYTGAGSTGWIASCSPREHGSFSKTDRKFGVYSREIRSKGKGEVFLLKDFLTDKNVAITSEMNGGIAIDSLVERTYSFPPGTIGTFSLSSKYLRVVV